MRFQLRERRYLQASTYLDLIGYLCYTLPRMADVGRGCLVWMSCAMSNEVQQMDEHDDIEEFDAEAVLRMMSPEDDGEPDGGLNFVREVRGAILARRCA